MAERAAATSDAGTRPGGIHHVIVFDPEITGHHLNYLNLLRNNLELWPSTVAQVTFLVSPSAPLDEWRASRAGQVEGSPRLTYRSLTPREQRGATHDNLLLRSLWQWRILRRHAALVGSDHLFVMYFDHLQLALGLRLPLGRGRSVSGILFRPSTHYRALTAVAPTRSERLRDGRKEVAYRLMFSHPGVHRVLSLDPEFPAHAPGGPRTRSKVMWLPDPAPRPTSAADVPSLPRHDLAGEGRVRLLLFGALSARKGVLVLLDALGRVGQACASRCSVVIAGRLDEGIRSEFLEGLEKLKATSPELALRVEERFLTDGELHRLIREADVILAPYQRFVGSSGVLALAASFGKPVITQDYGLAGHLVRRHRLGVAVDTTSPERLAAAIEELVSSGSVDGFDPVGAREFIAPCTESAFVTTLTGIFR